MRNFFLAAFALMMSLGAAAFTTDTIAVSGPGISHPVPAVVITPDGSEGQRFPVVYMLHGYTGDEYGWCNLRTDLGTLADSYGMIYVMPGVGDTWYWDAPGSNDNQIETFFTQTLVPYIDAQYPTVADRSKRAIMGLSMGGHGAFWLATRHPDIFGAAGSTSGGLDIRPFPTRWKMASIIGPKEGNEAVWDAHTVATMIPQVKAADLALIFDCGSEDFFAEVNDKFHRDLLQAGVPHDYISRPGTHNGAYWSNSVLYQLLFFDRFFGSRQ